MRRKNFMKINPRVKKILMIAVLLIIFLSLTLAVLRIYLNIQLILGYDVLIDLDVNHEMLSVMNDEEAEFVFTTYVRTNPFCSASCSYVLRDMSTLEVMDKSDGQVTLIEPLESSFSATMSRGAGARMYRYEMECHSERSFFCRTREHNTSRTLSVILEHELNEGQRSAKNDSRRFLETFREDISSAYSNVLSFNATLSSTTGLFPSDNVTGSLLADLNSSKAFLEDASQMWEERDYERLWEKISDEAEDLYYPIERSSNALFSLNYSIRMFNETLASLKDVRQKALDLNDILIWNKTLYEDAHIFLSSLNDTIRHFDDLTLLQEKVDAVDRISSVFENMSAVLEEDHMSKMDWLREESDNITSYICNHLNCSDYALVPVDINWTVNETCDHFDKLRAAYQDLNETQREQLNVDMPDMCSQLHPSISTIDAEMLGIHDVPYDVTFDLADNPRICCSSGSCAPCCEDAGCAKTPILFLHGHALDRESPPDLNMDTFNNIQHKLEDHGVLNMGRISLYRYFDMPPNLWRQFSDQISLKISYYYDVYTEDDSSIIVPTKNDNLDTYALRLDDIIDSVLHKTGSEDVIIISHSMGGLVVRRYMQIFGTEKIHSALTSGTPHHGISGWVATLCPLFGERLECRDMRQGSLFLNKLNREPLPDVPFYNIVATGCDMSGKDSDGVVLKDSAMLEGANNIIIEGDCYGTEMLHSTFVRDLHPGYHDAVKKFLGLG